MRLFRSVLVLLLAATLFCGSPASAAAPDAIEVTCDADRSAFRKLIRAASEATFRLFDAETGGIECASYTVDIDDLVVLKAKTDSVKHQSAGNPLEFDKGKPRKFNQIRVVLPGSCSVTTSQQCLKDADCPATETCEPATLCAGENWLEVGVGGKALDCGFSREGKTCAGGSNDGQPCEKDGSCSGAGARCGTRRQLHSVGFAQEAAGGGGIATDLECAPPGCVCTDDIGDSCVDGMHIVDGTVDSDDVANESLTGDDVEDGSLTGADIADGTIQGADLAAGAGAVTVGVKVRRSTAWPMPNNGLFNPVEWDVEVFDTSNFFDESGLPGVQPSTLTVPETGFYMIFVSRQTVTQGNDDKYRVLVNQTTPPILTDLDSGEFDTFSGVYALNAGDSVAFEVDAGGNVRSLLGPDTSFAIVKVP